MSLRERKKADTRRALMLEALRLFADRGYDETTVDDIAAAADVSPRTFFRYYPTKAAVLFGDFDERVEGIRDAVVARAEGESLLRAFRRSALATAAAMAEEPRLFTTRARLVFEHPGLLGEALLRMARIEAVIARAVADELRTDVERDLRPRLVAASVFAAIRSTALTWTARGGEGDPRELIDASFDALESGLEGLFEETRA